MTRAGGAQLTFVLSLVAAALALAAAAIEYSGTGHIRWALVAAAVFLVAFGIGAKKRA